MVSSDLIRSPPCSESTQVKNLRWENRTLTWPVARIIKYSTHLINKSLLELGYGLSDEQRASMKQAKERKRKLLLRLKNSLTPEQWKATAKELDVLEKNEAWKFDIESNEYDAPLVEMRLRQLNQAREASDIKQMLSLIRTALSRDLGGMGNVRLYTHSYVGTKDIIERYIDSTVATIRSLVRMSKMNQSDGIDIRTILEQVLCARQAFGRSALLLSGGGTCGMNHIGVLKALFDAKCLPRIISGSSAGSIVCSVLCTKTDAELPELLANFAYGDLAVFTEHNRSEGILEKLQRLLTQGFWIDNKHLIRVMKDLLGDMTFQEAYNRTRRILNIFVSSASIYELPRLLNYITSPNVMIWSAVAASCSVPLVFAAGSLLVKNPVTGENTPWDLSPQQFIDGSVEGDVPMARLAEMFNVNHFIVSQVNPHVMPFLINEERAVTRNVNKTHSSDWVNTLTKLAKDEILHRLHMLAEVGVFPTLCTKLNSVLSQKYSGDITILPELELKDLPLILTNPTPEFMERAFLGGERATWPKLSRIRNACAVELELDSAVQALRACLVFGNSPANLQGIVSTKPQDQLFKVRLKRGYSTTNACVRQSIDRNRKEFIHNMRRKKLQSSLYLTIPPRLYQMKSSIQSPLSARQLKLFAPFTSIEPRPELTDTNESSSSQYSDIENDTSSESNPEIDNCTIITMKTPVIDYFSSSQSVTFRKNRLLATSPGFVENDFNCTNPSTILQKTNSSGAVVEAGIDDTLKSQLFDSRTRMRLKHSKNGMKRMSVPLSLSMQMTDASR